MLTGYDNSSEITRETEALLYLNMVYGLVLAYLRVQLFFNLRYYIMSNNGCECWKWTWKEADLAHSKVLSRYLSQKWRKATKLRSALDGQDILNMKQKSH